MVLGQGSAAGVIPASLSPRARLVNPFCQGQLSADVKIKLVAELFKCDLAHFFWPALHAETPSVRHSCDSPFDPPKFAASSHNQLLRSGSNGQSIETSHLDRAASLNMKSGG